jgi:hypothetical protein
MSRTHLGALRARLLSAGAADIQDFTASRRPLTPGALGSLVESTPPCDLARVASASRALSGA